MRTGNTTLAALPRERLRRLIGAAGWARSLALRRVVAALLTLLAVVLALRPAPAAAGPSVGVLVATHDLPPGVLLTAADLRLAALPPDAVPSGALRDPAAAAGRVLAGPARAGEPLTDVRLLGPENTWLASGDPSAAAVPSGWPTRVSPSCCTRARGWMSSRWRSTGPPVRRPARRRAPRWARRVAITVGSWWWRWHEPRRPRWPRRHSASR